MTVSFYKNIILKAVITLSLIGLLGGRIFYLIKENEKNKVSREIKILNHIMPRSFDYLVKTFQAKEAFDERKLKSYLYYYQKVAEYMPERADAIGMTGFCLYQLGKKEKAIAAYQRALKVNPYFFWFYYNLGVMYLEQGQMSKAKDMFNQAKDQQPARTLFFIKNSRRIYLLLIMKRMKEGQQELMQQLKEDYRKSYILTQLLNKNVSPTVMKSVKLRVRMF